MIVAAFAARFISALTSPWFDAAGRAGFRTHVRRSVDRRSHAGTGIVVFELPVPPGVPAAPARLNKRKEKTGCDGLLDLPPFGFGKFSRVRKETTQAVPPSRNETTLARRVFGMSASVITPPPFRWRKSALAVHPLVIVPSAAPRPRRRSWFRTSDSVFRASVGRRNQAEREIRANVLRPDFRAARGKEAHHQGGIHLENLAEGGFEFWTQLCSNRLIFVSPECAVGSSLLKAPRGVCRSRRPTLR